MSTRTHEKMYGSKSTKRSTNTKRSTKTKRNINSHRNVSHHNSASPEYDEIDFQTKIDEIKSALADNTAQYKKLQKDLVELSQIHKKEVNRLSKKPRGNAGKYSGFNKPEYVPPSLRKLLNIDEDMLPRTEVTKRLYSYFNYNNMYSKSSARVVIPDDRVRRIFGMTEDDTLTFFNLQTWLKKVYESSNNGNRINRNANVLIFEE
jgi:chromatin remodeling complex protein RSC6